MNKKVLTVLQIVIPVVTIAGVAAVEGFYYATQRCTDEVPDTTSLYVYTVDREFGELNQRYAKAMGIEPKAKDRLITYDSIPEISSWNEVKDIYIFSDAACEAADEDYRAGKNIKLAVPSDVMFYYGDCSGTWSMFGDDEAKSVCLMCPVRCPSCMLIRHWHCLSGLMPVEACPVFRIVPCFALSFRLHCP